jgi:hypothetical protein
MTSVHTAAGEPKTRLAIAGGVLAGIFTLALIGGGLALTRDSGQSTAAGEPGDVGNSRLGTVIGADALEAGDCIDFNLGASVRTQFMVTECESSHIAEVTSRIQHPDAGGVYPGADAMGDWIAGQCETAAESYIDVPILETSLEDGALIPDFDAWSNGNYRAACYVKKVDSTSLTRSVAGIGAEFPRGEQVAVSRLINGDCFVPSEGESYDLNSNSMVTLASCDSGYNGLFFGRDTLEFPLGTLFPGEESVGEATSDRCADLFEAEYGVPATGFNYRYWRPNQQSWDLDDRTILCAILDDEQLQDRFEPAEHLQFFELATGECFNLGPEETANSLRLDDKVRVVRCTDAHLGQMIGSGDLDRDGSEPFPEDDGVLELAGTECEQLFLEFVGISPYESDLGNFPFWYPNEPGWEDGDRRFACAFLDDSPRSESLEGAES